MKKRKIMLFILLGMMLSVSTFAWADSDSNRQTFFNNITDSLATLGQSPEQKKETLNDRREERRISRENAILRRERAETRKKIKQQQQEIMQKLDGRGTAIGL